MGILKKGTLLSFLLVCFDYLKRKRPHLKIPDFKDSKSLGKK